MLQFTLETLKFIGGTVSALGAALGYILFNPVYQLSSTDFLGRRVEQPPVNMFDSTMLGIVGSVHPGVAAIVGALPGAVMAIWAFVAPKAE